MEKDTALVALLARIYQRIDELNNKLDTRFDKFDVKIDKEVEQLAFRIDRLEDDVSKAKGWTTAALSVFGVCGAFILEWFRRNLIGG